MSASFACEKAIYKGAHNGGVIPSAGERVRLRGTSCVF
jgi:hypothetical protein